MRRPVLLSLLLLCSPLLCVQAQNQENNIYQAVNEAFTVSITSRIYNIDNELIWDFETTKVTFLGRAVSVRLNGKHLTVLAHLTPYRENEEDFLLIAQGQVWISNNSEEGVKYLSTVKSIPLKLGERVYFLPLGVDYQKENYYIELDVQIASYNVEDSTL
jgi:hypothetical protein